MLGRYVASQFAVRMLGSLLALAAILQLLDLLDQAGTIIARTGLLGVGHYVALRLPGLLTEAIPFGVLIGALLTFMRLAGTQEVTAMRAAGLSLRQLIRGLLPLCAVVSLVQLVLQTEVQPRTDRAFSDWWTRNTPPAVMATLPHNRLWLRAQGDVAVVDQVSLDGRSLTGVTILQRNASGDLQARLDAREARYDDGGGWTLHDVRIAGTDASGTHRQAAAAWPHGPAPDNMVELAWPIGTQLAGRLAGVLDGGWIGGRGPAFYRTQLYGLIAALLNPVLMVVLAAPVLLTPPRAGAGGLATARGLGLGLGYMAFAGLLVALGGAGAMPPVMAGFGALVLAGYYGVTRLQRAEQG